MTNGPLPAVQKWLNGLFRGWGVGQLHITACAAAAAAAAAAATVVFAASPKSRLQYLQTPAMPWQRLVVYEVGQQGAMSGPFLCSSSSRSSGAGGQQQQQQEQLALEQVLQLPLMGYSHIVYVCNKPC
jgi:hypothetical protein